MEPLTAQMILYTILAGGFIVWLVGLLFLLRTTYGGPLTSGQQAVELSEAEGPLAGHLIIGSAEVEGQPPELAVRAASVLAQAGLSGRGQVKIVQQTDDRVTFESVGISTANRSKGHYGVKGLLQLTPATRQRTRIDYVIALSGGQWLLRAGAVTQVLGLIALFVGFGLIYTYVLPNPNPAVRWQVLQMLQVSHFLWPTFLFVGLYRLSRRQVQGWFEALVHNLPYL